MLIMQCCDESDVLSVEIEELKAIIKENNLHTKYVTANSSIFNSNDIKKDDIPIGTIEFVKQYLKAVHHVETMDPIEVPSCLRKPHLLLREYDIVESEKIPKKGEYFIKDASELKSFSYQGDMEYFFNNFDKDKNLINETHKYVVSEIINIISEYRVLVMDDKIYGIQFYDGDPTVMPNEKEINKIKEMVLRYTLENNRPAAYAMDIAIVRKDKQRDLAIIELQPFASMATYGCRGAFLINMYKKGMNWYINQGKNAIKAC